MLGIPLAFIAVPVWRLLLEQLTLLLLRFSQGIPIHSVLCQFDNHYTQVGLIRGDHHQPNNDKNIPTEGATTFRDTESYGVGYKTMKTTHIMHFIRIKQIKSPHSFY